MLKPEVAAANSDFAKYKLYRDISLYGDDVNREEIIRDLHQQTFGGLKKLLFSRKKTKFIDVDRILVFVEGESISGLSHEKKKEALEELSQNRAVQFFLKNHINQNSFTQDNTMLFQRYLNEKSNECIFRVMSNRPSREDIEKIRCDEIFIYFDNNQLHYIIKRFDKIVEDEIEEGSDKDKLLKEYFDQFLNLQKRLIQQIPCALEKAFLNILSRRGHIADSRSQTPFHQRFLIPQTMLILLKKGENGTVHCRVITYCMGLKMPVEDIRGNKAFTEVKTVMLTTEATPHICFDTTYLIQPHGLFRSKITAAENHVQFFNSEILNYFPSKLIERLNDLEKVEAKKNISFWKKIVNYIKNNPWKIFFGTLLGVSVGGVAIVFGGPLILSAGFIASVSLLVKLSMVSGLLSVSSIIGASLSIGFHKGIEKIRRKKQSFKTAKNYESLKKEISQKQDDEFYVQNMVSKYLKEQIFNSFSKKNLFIKIFFASDGRLISSYPEVEERYKTIIKTCFNTLKNLRTGVIAEKMGEPTRLEKLKACVKEKEIFAKEIFDNIKTIDDFLLLFENYITNLPPAVLFLLEDDFKSIEKMDSVKMKKFVDDILCIKEEIKIIDQKRGGDFYIQNTVLKYLKEEIFSSFDRKKSFLKIFFAPDNKLNILYPRVAERYTSITNACLNALGRMKEFSVTEKVKESELPQFQKLKVAFQEKGICADKAIKTPDDFISSFKTYISTLPPAVLFLLQDDFKSIEKMDSVKMEKFIDNILYINKEIERLTERGRDLSPISFYFHFMAFLELDQSFLHFLLDRRSEMRTFALAFSEKNKSIYNSFKKIQGQKIAHRLLSTTYVPDLLADTLTKQAMKSSKAQTDLDPDDHFNDPRRTSQMVG